VHRQDFSYHLPEELIAQSPLAERSASRLLMLDGATGGVADGAMGDLPGYLRAGDLLVFNDTRVVAARIVGSKPSGGRVEIFLERAGTPAADRFDAGRRERLTEQSVIAADEASGSRECGSRETGSPEGEVRESGTRESEGRESGTRKGGTPESATGESSGTRAAGIAGSRPLRSCEALVQLRASKPIREGLQIATPGGVVRVVGREDELWRVETPGGALEFFEEWGEVPLPPYIHRAADASDRERYQSIFAREKGAVAAPTASLHFDASLVRKLDAMGVGRAFITLHVGAGTFQPLRTDDLDAHKMHAERVSVSRATWDAIRRTRAAGGRVVAVGTTVVRALESTALEVVESTEPVALGMAASAAEESTINAWSGETRLFIRPGFKFQVVDAMVTNFHLPESTLLMLVSAFAGRENVLAAYAHAVRERYRFFSYGDAMFVMPVKPTARLISTPAQRAAQGAAAP
jgi:S-adenosylmethionine:tRNA ribosyltransferase-isomerase